MIAMDHHAFVGIGQRGVVDNGSRGEMALRPELEGAVFLHDALAESNRADVAFADGAQRHDEAACPLSHA